MPVTVGCKNKSPRATSRGDFHKSVVHTAQIVKLMKTGCKQTSKNVDLYYRACIIKIGRELPLPSAIRLTPVSLRLGHARVLTTHRVVIHYARAASLPQGEGSQKPLFVKEK